MLSPQFALYGGPFDGLQATFTPDFQRLPKLLVVVTLAPDRMLWCFDIETPDRFLCHCRENGLWFRQGHIYRWKGEDVWFEEKPVPGERDLVYFQRFDYDSVLPLPRAGEPLPWRVVTLPDGRRGVEIQDRPTCGR